VLGLVVGIACAVFMVGMLIYAQKYKRRLVADTAGLGTWAADHGYTFVAVDDSWLPKWTFAPFGIGRYQQAKNLVRGEYLEMDFAVFDYTYQTSGVVGSGGATAPKIWHDAVVVVRPPHHPPWFDVRRRTGHPWTKKDANEFTIGDAEFDHHWWIHSDDETYARAALSEATRAKIVELELTGVHIVEGQLVAWRQDSHHTAERIPAKLDGVAQLAAGLPPVP
jgi:hypothetical protein